MFSARGEAAAAFPRTGCAMADEFPVPHQIRFGPYTADLRSRELYKSGIRLKLRDQSFRILWLLLERPGEVVTREELRQKLWLEETFVDFDHGLNAAVERLRRCLNDSASAPVFIETLPRRGYRFIGKLDTATPELVAVIAQTPVEVPVTAPPETYRTVLVVSTFVIVAAGLLLLLGIPWSRATRASGQNPHQTMLAVLPFENLSGDPNQEYFSDGLTEELITQLGALSPDQLAVIARTTSMAYKRTTKSAQQIASELGVDYVLESSIRRDGDQMRISVQLIRARDQVHVWAQSYDRGISNSIAVQEEVAKAVAEQIRIALSPAYSGSRRSHPLDPQANEAYLRGRYFWNQFTVEGYRKAIDYFQQAIDRDPNFAEAYSGLSDSYYFLVVTDSMSPQDGESKALAAARQAVALGDGLAESHSALASVMMGPYQWSTSEAEFKRAIELNPSYSSEHRLYAALLMALGRKKEAWEQINQAMRTDPLSLPNNAEVVRTLYYARDYDRALEQAKRGLQLNPDYYRIHFWMARVYAQKGMHDKAVEEAEKVVRAMPDTTLGLTELAYSLATDNRPTEARDILRRLEEKSRHTFVPAYSLAVIHIALNEREDALRELHRAYEERDWALLVLGVEPRLDPLRSDSRFEELVREVGLER
jgi:TolB-like protein/DNA-binding winged helix-turn-helix (wHTH) protein/Tfp pilus assembly protein PilF